MHWSPHHFAITGNQQADVFFLKTAGIPKRYACGCFLLQDYMNSKAFSRFRRPVLRWNFTPIHCKCIAPWVHFLFVVFFTLLGLCNIQYLNSNFKPPNPNWQKIQNLINGNQLFSIFSVKYTRFLRVPMKSYEHLWLPSSFLRCWKLITNLQFDYNDRKITIGWAREFETEEGKLIGSLYKKGACSI